MSANEVCNIEGLCDLLLELKKEMENMNLKFEILEYKMETLNAKYERLMRSSAASLRPSTLPLGFDWGREEDPGTGINVKWVFKPGPSY